MDHETIARIQELRKELAKVEAKIAELTPVPQPEIDVKAEVLNMSNNTEWKEFIINKRVIENITSILDGCYDSYIECIQEEFPNKNPKDYIGKFGSNKWLNFQVETMKELLKSFSMEDDFSDTAGGCDEVAWDAGFDVIREWITK